MPDANCAFPGCNVSKYKLDESTAISASYKSSFHHVLPSNDKPCNGFAFSHSLSPPTTLQLHLILCTPV